MVIKLICYLVAVAIFMAWLLLPLGDPETGAGSRELPDIWDSLDSAAFQNLDSETYNYFLDYKNRLKLKGFSWEEAEPTLRGFIWDNSEDKK